MNYFDKLRPYTDFEVCNCVQIESLLLVYTLTDNPIHCYVCKGEIDPERIGLNEEQVNAVATWHQQFRSLYDLWLDSGEYEGWAKQQLLRKDGSVNIQGLVVARELTRSFPTYYWWFQDSDDPLPSECPACGAPLQPAIPHGKRQCNVCRIVI